MKPRLLIVLYFPFKRPNIQPVWKVIYERSDAEERFTHVGE